MPTSHAAIPKGRPFTVADLEAMPDDGNRYELTKKAFYERIGVPSYWLLDPTEPGSLMAFELRGGSYAEIAHVTGDEEFRATTPFPVTIVPTRLLDGLRP